jgi:anti-sigma B factor antagonist
MRVKLRSGPARVLPKPRLRCATIDAPFSESLEELETMELGIKTDHDARVCAVTVDGEIDVHTAPQLKEALVAAVESGCPNIIVDLEKVGFIDSSGLGVLVSALRRARERDGVVRIVCTRDNVLKIFRITGLDKVFPIFADPAEALRF